MRPFFTTELLHGMSSTLSREDLLRWLEDLKEEYRQTVMSQPHLNKGKRLAELSMMIDEAEKKINNYGNGNN